MGRSWLPTVFAVGAIGIFAVGGCAEKTADKSPQPDGAPRMNNDTLIKTNPEVRRQVLAQLEDRINKSNLPPEEKQRQIAQLRANGPPK